MPISTTANFPAGLDTWQAIDFTADHLGDANRELDLYVKKITNVIDRIEARIGVTNSTVLGTLDFMVNSDADKQVVNVQDFGVLPSASDSTNSFLFNLASASATYNHAVTWYFPPGTYNTTNFQLSRSQHTIRSGTGIYGVTINYTGVGAAGKCITIAGRTGASIGGPAYSGRIYGCGIFHININNGGNANSIAVSVRHGTGFAYAYMLISGFRGDGAGWEASNYADSGYYRVNFEFCSSVDDSNKPILKFWDDGNGEWAVDALSFVNCRWEVNGDRICGFYGTGFRVNKIAFIGCKFESSGAETYSMGGSNDANQAQFWLEGTSFILFQGCDFTLQNLRAGHAVLPTIFRLLGTGDLHMNSCVFSFGSGSMPKCFTNFFVLNNASQLLVLVDTWVNSGNSTAFPTQVIACTNSPCVVYRSVGFTWTQGSAKTAANWITGTVGNVGGAGGANGVIA